MNLQYTSIKTPSEIDIPELIEEPKFPDSEITISDKIVRIIKYQFEQGISDSIIKGFLFYGIPGTGKTVIAKKIAKDLGAMLYFVDGASIARAQYGDSEQVIKQIFFEARKRDKTIILFDDVESLFMSRDAMGLVREWHFSQNSVFFHEIDELNTSKIAVILTTNRYDLIDNAIKDRFYNIGFPSPTIDTLIKIMRKIATKQAIYDGRLGEMEQFMRENSAQFVSIRDVLKYVTKEYIDSIIVNKN